MMLALLEANPEAFSHRNVNTLETGLTLCFGPEDLDRDSTTTRRLRKCAVRIRNGNPVACGLAQVRMIRFPGRLRRGGGGEADALRPAEIIAGFEPRLARIEGLITELESRPGSEGVERALARLEMRVARIEDQLQVLARAGRDGSPDRRA